VPSFEDLKKIHDFIYQSEERVYVHCKGGYDRTGVVVATYFIYTGLTPNKAKKQFQKVFKPMKGRYLHEPLIESKWKVLEDYKKWLANLPKEKTPVEINHHAVRVLWEGLNNKKEFRRVLYLPYVDGYVTLLVTDADGMTVQVLRDVEISKQYLPEEYWDDVPENYTWGRPDPDYDR
jgi:hypothetical protein